MTTGLETEAPPTAGLKADSPEPVPILFVGGTGRSGTHVVSKILGNHSSYRKVPNEARFHTDPGGYPDVLAGRTGPELFIYRLRHHWWRNFEARRFTFRGIHRYVPKARLDAASKSFLRRFGTEPEAALRQLFFDLLWPLATEWSKSGLIEQSCDTVAEAGTLGDLFPEARFVHVVRDGRDVAASRVGQARWLAYPRTMDQGLEWWEGRIRRIDSGVRAVGADRVHAVSLDDLVSDDGRRRTYSELRRFAGLPAERDMLDYFKGRVKVRNAHTERWRDAVPAHRQAEVDERYERILEGLERDGVHGAALLRRTRERSAR
ncbi:MAG: sulfotransferase [Solirubrobacterales bacterium]|nr:sulfotransferase [Solirubrobacterales bacterium]